MNIKVDLRPEEHVRRNKKLVSLSRIISLSLVLSFLLVAGTTVFYGFMKTHIMTVEILRLEKQISTLTSQNVKMSVELKNLRGQEVLYKQALVLLKEELPCLEFFDSLEETLPQGVWLENISVNPGRVQLKGYAFRENDVVEFARGLLEAGVIDQIGFPATSRINRDGKQLVSFTLGCHLRNISDIGKIASTGVER